MADGPPAVALDITDYSATVNDRFTGGFPTNPTPNTSGSFVGAAYDWSGVGWSTTIYAASSYKGLALLSPRHFLTAQHYENGGLLTQGVTIRGNDGLLVSQTNSGITNLGYGAIVTNGGVTANDLALGTLAAPIASPTNVFRYGVLDLFTSSVSTSYSVYNGLGVLAYGRGNTTNDSPRAGAATVNQTGVLSSDPTQTVILTLRSGTPSVQLVEGDSGSPLLNGWTNPNGGKELTVLGLNSGVSGNYNIMSLLAAPGAMANATDAMAVTGYALRVVGNPSATWQGGSGGPTTQDDLSRTGNWSSNSVPTDLYTLFSGTSTAVRSIDLNAAVNLRGLAFKGTATGTLGFTFSGANTLTIGRGGLTNYDTSRQTFSNTVALGDTQYWDVGSGGVTAASINTNGWLLEIAGSGTARITGAVSGSGGLALSGNRLELTGSSSYTGGTWVHSGALVVNGNIAASSGVALDAGVTLGGSGRVSAISGAGIVGPGNSPGILTATSVNPTSGLDFNFEFGKTGAPIWATGTASGNDVLRLTAGSSPFTTALGSANAVDVYLGVTSLALNDTFQGGFFTDASASFLSSIQNAAFTYYVLGNGLGTAKTYNGQGYYLLDTSFWPSYETVSVSTVSVASANFADGTVTNGQVMQLVMVPEPAAIGLALLGVALAAVARRK
ncbi:MAG: PEP-CTERM sorting domain-containing protein [Planctomycetia bacterium]